MADPLFEDAFLSQVYDAWHPRSVRDDYDFYLPLIRRAGVVLDAGCGTGSLLAEARRTGHQGRLCGLDPASGMIGLARKNRDITWVIGELRDAPWINEFDLVVMTGHAFQAIVTDDELLASLRAVRRALMPGGRFAFETRNPDFKAWEQWGSKGPITVVCESGAVVQIKTNVDRSFDGNTVSFTHIFEGEHPSLPQKSSSTLRFLDASAVRSLLHKTGFKIEDQFGSFEGGPITSEAPEIITVAAPAADMKDS